MAMKFNRNFNINNVVKRLVRSVLALYVGGTIMTVFGTVMTCTSSPFYTGLSLIGWTVASANATGYGAGSTAFNAGANCTDVAYASGLVPNTVVATTGSGVLAVVGIIAIAQIVTEFISW